MKKALSFLMILFLASPAAFSQTVESSTTQITTVDEITYGDFARSANKPTVAFDRYQKFRGSDTHPDPRTEIYYEELTPAADIVYVESHSIQDPEELPIRVGEVSQEKAVAGGPEELYENDTYKATTTYRTFRPSEELDKPEEYEPGEYRREI